MKIPSMNIPPYESSSLWKLPPRNMLPRKLPPMKIPVLENYPHEIPSPLISHINERKNKITKIFCLEECYATEHPYGNNQGLFWYTNDLIKILGLDIFFAKWKKSQKLNESKNHQMGFTCQLYKSRRTKTRQWNYKILQICETTK